MKQLTIRVGGEAGWGVATAADIIAAVFIKLDYHIFSSKDYASQIKGGTNIHTIRASKEKVHADIDSINVLMALDKNTIKNHINEVISGGIVLYNNKFSLENLDQENKNLKFIPVPLKKIEEELSENNIHNAVFLGATTKSLGIKLEVLNQCIEEFFQAKPELKVKLLKAAEAGYNSVNTVNDYIITEKKTSNQNIKFWSGNDAITKGALKAGLTFHVQYPMTPVSAILHNLSKESTTNNNLTVIQPEDEIAAINMALGASYTGARAMTATSGGGFALMVESLGLSAMAEIPLVIIEGQRPGPATGLPTKTEQGDLKFVLSAAPGDIPRIVIAPGNIEECYTETKRSFYLAEKYQVPAIVLIDKHLAESFKTVNLETEEPKFTFDYNSKINIIENSIDIKDSDLNQDGLYKRYAKDNTKRTVPGIEKGIYTCAGDEHDEVGEITEDKEIRNGMIEKRMNKLKEIEEEFPEPKIIGPEDSDITVISWGSNKGAIREAINKLNLEGNKINFLPIKFMCPFQTDKIKKILENMKRIILIENNYSGQLGSLIQEKSGIEIKDKILRYDGFTFTIDDIYKKLKERLA
jgi:2-oxoglutarate/2-oxoacid ferredoxin oxidoreductase subunit alpha